MAMYAWAYFAFILYAVQDAQIDLAAEADMADERKRRRWIWILRAARAY